MRSRVTLVCNCSHSRTRSSCLLVSATSVREGDAFADLVLTVWLTLATYMSWPVSTTYSIVSAVLGVGSKPNHRPLSRPSLMEISQSLLQDSMPPAGDGTGVRVWLLSGEVSLLLLPWQLASAQSLFCWSSSSFSSATTRLDGVLSPAPSGSSSLPVSSRCLSVSLSGKDR